MFYVFDIETWNENLCNSQITPPPPRKMRHHQFRLHNHVLDLYSYNRIRSQHWTNLFSHTSNLSRLSAKTGPFWLPGIKYLLTIFVNQSLIIVISVNVFKGSQLGTFFPLAIVYCYLEFKLCYLKNLKLFSIRVKESFEPIVLRKKKATGFCSFYNIFLEKPIFEWRKVILW